jgi:aryl-alcohol dehydrogenase-like predicted oxidoreductase
MLMAGHYSLAEARTSLEISLRELGLDVIDLLFVHECRRADPVNEDVIAWLEQLKTQGIIRAWGFATGDADADHYQSAYRAANAVLQRELRLQDLGDATTGLICQAPFSLLSARLAQASAPARTRFDAWTCAHELRNEDLPALLLETALHASTGQVILCSMFHPAHVRTNTHCLVEPRFPAELRREFVRQLADLVPAIEAA